MSEEGRVALKGASHPPSLSLSSLSVFRFRREEITKKAVSEWVQIHLDAMCRRLIQIVMYSDLHTEKFDR